MICVQTQFKTGEQEGKVDQSDYVRHLSRCWLYVSVFTLLKSILVRMDLLRIFLFFSPLVVQDVCVRACARVCMRDRVRSSVLRA